MRYRLSFLEACLRHAPGAECWARDRWRFDVSAEVFVVGAPMGPGEPGCVLVLSKPGSGPGKPMRLLPETSVPGDNFGAQLAVFEGALVVAAPSAGALYLFADGHSGWQQVERVEKPPSLVDVAFGNAVDVSAELVVVGGERTPRSPGVVAIYRRRGGNLKLEALLTTPSPQSDEAFGYSVGAFDDEIIVGSPSDTGPGAAYVYRRRRRLWQLTQTLQPPDSTETRAFGCHIGHAFGEPVVVAGATFGRGEDTTAVAYLFQRGEELWHRRGEFDRNVHP